jgi:S-adenosylmethionine:tRNA ribosyltransferase-isomerase
VNLPPIHISDYNYQLKDEQIAKYPLEKRSASKLLYYKKGNIEHKMFKELPSLLPENTLLVFNDTKVIEARLIFKKESGTGIEVFLLNPADHTNNTIALHTKKESVWECMIGNKKRWKENEVLELKNDRFNLKASWHDRENNLVKFSFSDDETLSDQIKTFGSLPIPPYLNRPTEKIDLTRYQTGFAKAEGSVAAPTASLHFDDEVKNELAAKGIKQKFLTLHVGAGTFKPVSVENAIEHSMHAEYIIFTKDTIEDLLNHNGPIIPVGTTSLRSLESLYWYGVGLKKNFLKEFYIEQYFPYQFSEEHITKEESLSTILNWMDENELKTLEGNSSIYIVPGYKTNMVNGIVTNFHQPQSTLLLLVSALIGNNWKMVYQSAMENHYRFLSYGDSSLLLF